MEPIPANSKKLTYFQKDEVKCPVCSGKFRREALLSGSGRLLAGDLLPDLRRIYKPSPRFGLANPLIYSIPVCPQCPYAPFPEDFNSIKPEKIQKFTAHLGRRKKHCLTIFGNTDFKMERNLVTGAASYFLCLNTYSYLEKDSAPSLKKGIAAMRASWLCQDILKNNKKDNYEYLYEYFRKLALKCYGRAIEAAQSGAELFDSVKRFGPDTDKDYGYDGALYIFSYLTYEMRIFLADREKKIKSFLDAKRSLSRVFGLGKASKEKPGPLLEIAKETYNNLNTELQSLNIIDNE